MLKLNKNWFYTVFYFFLFSCNELEYKSKIALKNSEEICQTTFSQIIVKNLHAPEGVVYFKSRGFISSPHGPSIRIFNSWIKYNFSQNEIVDQNNENWDIAFKGDKIIVNGGSSDKDDVLRTKKVKLALIEKDFDYVEQIPNESEFELDSKESYALNRGGGNGWHNDLNFLLFAINPIKNRTLIIKTHDNRYVKMEIKSYYKDGVQPTFSNLFTRKPEYYTFKFQFANEQGKFDISKIKNF